MLLDQATIKKLKTSGLSIIGVSLDSPLAEKHDDSRGVRGLFRKNIENIIICHKYALPVYITTIATKKNLYDGELFLMTKLAESFKIKLRILSSIQCGLWHDKEDIKLDPIDILNLKKYLKKDKVYWERADQDFPESSFVCSALDKSYIYISAYGDEKLDVILDRMINSKLYEGLDHFDCPVNSAAFRQKAELDKSTDEYPKKYRIIS
jgi:MoaA/NifB/PqqE/SkfB family radical SAM enzyme